MPIFYTHAFGEDHEFEYEMQNEFNTITFFVYSIPRDPNRYYHHTFVPQGDGSYQSSMMTINNNIEFRMKGIPEKILEIAGEELNTDIVSSPLQANENNFMNGDSIRVWIRLCQLNENAEMDEVLGRYILRRNQN